VDAHAALTNPHAATSAATASRLVLRDAAGRAQVVAPSAANDIATKGYADGVKSMASNGYAELPGGLKINWGTVAVAGNVTVNFPSAFPNACVWAVCGFMGGAPSQNNPYVQSISASQITLYGSSGNLSWIAIGY
jgi:hypothetical protein